MTERNTIYQIKLDGHIGPQWADWFDGLSITQDEGQTLLTGPVPDQPALYGVLKKVRDLGVPLLSVNILELDTFTHIRRFSMKAIVNTQYGSPDVLQLKEVA
ncbi:MAG TPA: hypothetical protein PKE23_01620, partial [Anaerolineales bacterium]|nr:hypothetical protein [Anaerolineales bacterium]